MFYLQDARSVRVLRCQEMESEISGIDRGTGRIKEGHL